MFASREGVLSAPIGARLKVVMLVDNPCVNDSRVIREAEALAQAGHNVTVLARRAAGLPIQEIRNDVRYFRVASILDNWRPSQWRGALLAAHCRSAPFRSAWHRWAFSRATAVSIGAGACGQPSLKRGSGTKTAPSNGSRQSTMARLVRFLKTKLSAPAKSAYQFAETSGAVARTKRILTAPKRRIKNIVAPLMVFEFVEIAMRRHLLRMRPDVIHAHDLTTLPTASHAAAKLGAKLVYDSHELEMHRNAKYSASVWKRRGAMEKEHIGRADLVITVSESIADHLRDAYSIAPPIVVLNAPPLIEVRIEGVPSIRRELCLHADIPLAIYVGSVTINRGIEFCIRALAHYPELHFAALGPRNKALEVQLLDIAEKEGVTDRFHLVDPVSPDAVTAFVRDADVSVLPIQNVCLSYYYCMPNKLFESVIGGLPVAVADLFELRRFVERFGCGVVMDETDPIDIARAIRAVVERRGSYILEGANLDTVRRDFSWDAQAFKLVEAYRKFELAKV